MNESYTAGVDYGLTTYLRKRQTLRTFEDPAIIGILAGTCGSLGSPFLAGVQRGLALGASLHLEQMRAAAGGFA